MTWAEQFIKLKPLILSDETIRTLRKISDQRSSDPEYWNTVRALLACGLIRNYRREEENNNFRLAFDGMIVDVFRTAREHGWHDEERNDGECIALMHSELSEALEALRKNPLQKDEHCPAFTNLEVELADCVIRIMDYAGMRNLDVAGAILAKAEYNRTRPVKHGGKKF